MALESGGLGSAVSGLLRAARRRADLSQRQLAKKGRASHGTVGRIESGELVPSLAMMERLLAACGFRIVVVDQRERKLQPMVDSDNTLDGARRRFPAHLDVILDPLFGEWWGDIYGLARPPETFYRDRGRRDRQRLRSQWEVRVARFRRVEAPYTEPGFYGMKSGPAVGAGPLVSVST
ncbi:helix-turn-helix domain-containing protein [Asanoa siamensis]|uniref:helix-turn-helix domain-containing protein n=1 Tax=Asanoa siamensis TaxID=926357 RepID=UPI0019419DEA|nr:helix-turn-helix transcriptional regulator [Asanoa siamensis]